MSVVVASVVVVVVACTLWAITIGSLTHSLDAAQMSEEWQRRHLDGARRTSLCAYKWRALARALVELQATS